MKKIIILMMCLFLLAGCGVQQTSNKENDSSVPQSSNTKNGYSTQSDVKVKEFKVSTEVEKDDLDVVYQFAEPENVDDGNIIINVYRLTKNQKPNLWGSHLVKLDVDNYIKVAQGALKEDAYYKVDGDGALQYAVSMRVNAVPIEEQSAMVYDKTVSFNHLYITDDFVGTIGEEILLGYMICSENRELFKAYDEKYFFDSGSIPESNYWFEVFAVTMTVVEGD